MKKSVLPREARVTPREARGAPKGAAAIPVRFPNKKVSITTLRRGDCFGELALLEEDDPKKCTLRKTSIIACGDAPLVLLKFTSEMLLGLGQMHVTWRTELLHHIRTAGVAGGDWAVLMKTGALAVTPPEDEHVARSRKSSEGKRRLSLSSSSVVGSLRRIAARASTAISEAGSRRGSRSSRFSRFSRASNATGSRGSSFAMLLSRHSRASKEVV